MNPIKSDNYVYIVSCGNAIKIGVSALPEQRISLIRTDNYQPIETISMYKSRFAYEIERDLHEVLEEDRIRGEWFRATKREAYIIASCIEPLEQDYL